MSEANAVPPSTHLPKASDTITVLDRVFGPLLNAQADLLAGAEATWIEWLHRRHEAVDDARRLLAGRRNGGDLSDAVTARQTFVARSFQRMAADADACHSAAQRLLDCAPKWFPNGGWAWLAPNGHAETHASTAQSMARPLEMGNNPD